MQKQWDGTAAPAGVPDEETMALIGRYAKTPPEPERVYCFAVRLCDNDIDRDYERFDDAALREMAPLFEGKAGLFDHQWSARQQVARLYKTEVVRESGRVTRDGRPYQYLKGYAYMLRGESRDALIADIEGGIKREVSVGLSCAKAVCSLCGEGWGQCGHEKGRTYDGDECHVVLSKPTDAYEWSFVAVPAQKEAGVLKKWSADSGQWTVGDGVLDVPQKDSKAPRIEHLHKQAELGRLFAAELGREVCRLGVLCGLPGEVLAILSGRLEAGELITLRDALKTQVSRRFPERPQLFGTVAPGGTAAEPAYIV